MKTDVQSPGNVSASLFRRSVNFRTNLYLQLVTLVRLLLSHLPLLCCFLRLGNFNHFLFLVFNYFNFIIRHLYSWGNKVFFPTSGLNKGTNYYFSARRERKYTIFYAENEQHVNGKKFGN